MNLLGLTRTTAWWTPRATNLLLLCAGASLWLLFVVGVREQTHYIMPFSTVAAGQVLLYLISVWLVLRARSNRATFFLIIGFAILFRLAVLFWPPQFSSDIYRYVWDGRVQADEINPYRYIPADPALEHLRDQKIYPNINRRDYALTIYPPGAQIIFFAVTRVGCSVIWMKVVILGFEALTCWWLIKLLGRLGMAREHFLIYAWHPLLVWEFAGSGHIDAAAIAFLTLALLLRSRNRGVLTGVALGCATLIKFFPILIFPALYKRKDKEWKMPAALAGIVILGYLPYLSVGKRVFGFLSGYAQEEGLLRGERYFLLNFIRKMFWAGIPTSAYIAFVSAVLAALAVWCFCKDTDLHSKYWNRALILAATATMLFSPRYLWYYAWLVPFLCMEPFVPLLYLTSAGFYLYSTGLGQTDITTFWLNIYLYVPFLILSAVHIAQKKGV